GELPHTREELILPQVKHDQRVAKPGPIPNSTEPLPIAPCGAVLLIAGIVFLILQVTILRTHGRDSVLAKAVARDFKGKLRSCSTPRHCHLPSCMSGWLAASICWLH
ncbi:MAG: hypothetical protein ACI89X_004931, partial [Planctomycetota bacterium]